MIRRCATASLALWRGFAWTSEGSPREGFQLDAEAILASASAADRQRALAAT